MTEFFDKDGNPVTDVYTKEQVEQMIAEAKNVPPAPSADVPPAPATPDTLPDWAKPLLEKVDTLSQTVERTHFNRIAASLPAEERTKMQENYNRLTGYDNTPEGIEARAQVAYLMTTGQQYTANNVDLGTINAAGNGRININDKQQTTETDAFFGKMLGISEEDRAKYAPK